MERMSEGLIFWKDMLDRHDYTVFVWDMQGEEGYPALIYVSDNIRQYGYEADEYLNGTINWLDMVVEEDKGRVDQEGCQFLLRASGNLLQEYRIRTKDGVIAWIEANSCYLKNEATNNDHVEMIIRNITRNKEKEQLLLENQLSLQNEIFTYMDAAAKKSFKENLIEFIKEQKIETLQEAFSDIYGIHASVIGRDYYCYTQMTGPKEEAGIFYDLTELRSFRRKLSALEEILDTGQRNVILSMQNPDIKITGVPIFYKNEYVATWVMCCLKEKGTEEIIKILEFMRIMAESISEYYSNHIGEMSAKGYAFERHRLQKRVLMQEKLLEMYEEMDEKSLKERLYLILKKAGETTSCGRCTLYEAVPNSIYARCVCSWMTQEASWNIMEREMYSVQALPNPGSLLKDQDIVVLNSTRIPKEWCDTMCDLYASAAVLIPVEWKGKTGFLSFQEIGQGRVWEEESIWFFGEIKKIIEKALLKSE